jgi:hypothetical protein
MELLGWKPTWWQPDAESTQRKTTQFVCFVVGKELFAWISFLVVQSRILLAV